MTDNKGFTRQDYLDAYLKSGSMRAVAREFGVNESSVRRSLRNDPAVQRGMNSLGLQVVPGVAWIKTKPTATEPGYSFMVRTGAEDDTLDRIRAAFDGMTAAPAVPAPEYDNADLLTIYPIADAHIGMQAWGRETGEDYDTAKAVARLREWIGACVAASPPSETAIILDVGDLTHADDQTNMTPRSKHVLDVDTRHFRTLDLTIAALATSVELTLQKHARVIVRILPGNHNPQAYMAVMFALAERYRLEPRVEVQKVPGEHFLHVHGRVMIAAHHGDKAKAERMVLWLADTHPAQWGATQYRYLFTGHLHHHRSSDIGGVQWEQLRAVSAKDAYAVSHAYSARAQLQAITYDKRKGEVQRVKVGS